MTSLRHSLCCIFGLLGCFLSTIILAANISISDVMVREVPAVSANTAGYLTLLNNSKQVITLKSVDSDLAARTEIHGHSMKGGMMKMFKVSGGLELPPGKPVTLEAGGYHIMLMGLKAELKEGDKVELTLHFSDGDAVDITAPVKKLSMKEHHHHH